MKQDLRFKLEPENQEKLSRLCGPPNSTLKQVESALKINNLVHKLRIFYATHSLKLGISVNYFITTTHYLDILMERHTETTKEIKYCNLILI